MTAPVRVLGIDPGLTRCGLGVVEGPVARPRALHHDCVRTGADRPLEQRLVELADAIAEAIDTYRPDVVAVERVLFSNNVRTAMATGQAAGVALLAGGRAGLPVASYTPTEIKLTVAGDGAAAKDAVGRMVAAQLGLDRPPSPADVADALAVALTHLARSRLSIAAAASGELAEAERDARRAARGGWQAVLERRGLLSGGTR